MDIVSTFRTVRDIPYRIPFTLNEEDKCCNGKHKMLKDLLVKQGLKVRYIVCTFLWSSIKLPKKILDIPHDDYGTHLYLEVLVGNKWIIVDATWDKGLKRVFHVNDWDGKSNTEIAVKPIEIFTPQKSAEIMSNKNNKETSSDLKVDKKFCKAFNNWLNENRKVSVLE